MRKLRAGAARTRFQQLWALAGCVGGSPANQPRLPPANAGFSFRENPGRTSRLSAPRGREAGQCWVGLGADVSRVRSQMELGDLGHVA